MASRQIIEGRFEQARANLVPVAYAPHPIGPSEFARRVIEDIDDGEADEPLELLALLGGGGPVNAGNAEATEDE